MLSENRKTVIINLLVLSLRLWAGLLILAFAYLLVSLLLNQLYTT